MQSLITNSDSARVSSVEFIHYPELKSNRQTRVWGTKTRLLINPETFIGLEFSLVAEVECVFVDRVENGKDLRVMVIIGERDPKVRAKVYARERAIIDEYANLDFDFHIIARVKRNLADIVNDMGKLAFKR